MTLLPLLHLEGFRSPTEASIDEIIEPVPSIRWRTADTLTSQPSRAQAAMP